MPINHQYFAADKLAVAYYQGTPSDEEALASSAKVLAYVGNERDVSLFVDLRQLLVDKLPLDVTQRVFDAYQRADPDRRITKLVVTCSARAFENAMDFRNLAKEANLPVNLYSSIASAAAALRIPEDTLTALIELTRTGDDQDSEA